MSPAARRRLIRILAAAAAVLAAGLAGYAARVLLPPRNASLIEAVSPSTASVPPGARAPQAEPGRSAVPRIPATLPDIALPDRTGVLRHFSDWKGRPLLVNFWAPWCAPCREEIPLLERLDRQRPHVLQVIGVAVDSRPAVLRYARHARIRYPVLIGLQRGLEVIRALGMGAVFPFSVFVDARGRIVTLKIGRLHADEVRLIAARLEALDRRTIDLSAARHQIAAGIERLAVARAHRNRPGG